jgi:hypothetical protein
MLLFLFPSILAMIEALELSEVLGLGLLLEGLPKRFMFPLLPLDGLLFLLTSTSALALPLATGSGISWSPPLSFPTSSGSLGRLSIRTESGFTNFFEVWRFQLPKGKEDLLLHDPGSVIVSSPTWDSASSGRFLVISIAGSPALCSVLQRFRTRPGGLRQAWGTSTARLCGVPWHMPLPELVRVLHPMRLFCGKAATLLPLLTSS